MVDVVSPPVNWGWGSIRCDALFLPKTKPADGQTNWSLDTFKVTQ